MVRLAAGTDPELADLTQGHNTCATAGATNDPGAGSQTFYWTNQQSGRLMFYHDHAWGITRLNVYAGEAAGYLIQDPVERALVNGGTVGGRTFTAGTIPSTMIPLVIQDKTFVNAATILGPTGTDPTWNWGRRREWKREYHRSGHRRPLVAPCLHAGRESL